MVGEAREEGGVADQEDDDRRLEEDLKKESTLSGLPLSVAHRHGQASCDTGSKTLGLRFGDVALQYGVEDSGQYQPFRPSFLLKRRGRPSFSKESEGVRHQPAR